MKTTPPLKLKAPVMLKAKKQRTHQRRIHAVLRRLACVRRDGRDAPTADPSTTCGSCTAARTVVNYIRTENPPSPRCVCDRRRTRRNERTFSHLRINAFAATTVRRWHYARNERRTSTSEEIPLPQRAHTYGEHTMHTLIHIQKTHKHIHIIIQTNTVYSIWSTHIAKLISSTL